MQLFKNWNVYIILRIILFIAFVEQSTLVCAQPSTQLPELPSVNSQTGQNSNTSQNSNTIVNGTIQNGGANNVTPPPSPSDIANTHAETKNEVAPKVTDNQPQVKDNASSQDKKTGFTPWDNNTPSGGNSEDKKTTIENIQKINEIPNSTQIPQVTEPKPGSTTQIPQVTEPKPGSTTQIPQGVQPQPDSSAKKIPSVSDKLLEDASKVTDKIKSITKSSNSSTQSKSKQKEADHFLKQELLSVLGDETDLPYDLSPIYYDDKTLTDDQRKELKDKVKTIVTNVEGANLINKLLMINYKVAKPSNFITTKENLHLPKTVEASRYNVMAFEAIARGDFNGVRALLNNHVPINVTNQNGETLLIYATLMKQIDIIRLLLAKGANVNAVDSKGYTALHIAVLKEDYNIVKVLLVMGANKSIRNHLGKTPLDYAINKGDTSLIQLLS